MKRALIFLCVLAVVAIASPAWATDLYFYDGNPADSLWTTVGNWADVNGVALTVVPGGSNVDTVYMGGNKTCILNSNAGTMKRLHGSYDTNLGTLQLEDGAYLEVWTYSFFGLNGPAKVVQNGGTMDMNCNQDWPWGSGYASMYELHGGTFNRPSGLTYWLIDGDGGTTISSWFKQDGGVHSSLGAMEVAVGSLSGSTAEVELSGGTTSIDEFSIMRKGLGGSGASGTGTGILNIVGSGSSGITIGTYLQANPGVGLDAILECEIDAGGITTINVTGTATFEDGCLLDMEIASGVTLTPGQTFDLMTAPDGGITGMPTLKAEDDPAWDIAIVSGSDILRATYVPEPATLTLLGLGGLGVLIRRKRR